MTGTATALLDNWKKAKVPAELHVFQDGGHGFGMNKKGRSSDAWIELLGAMDDPDGAARPDRVVPER
jgi:hypothetical protein